MAHLRLPPRHERELERSSTELKAAISKGCNHLRKLLDAREVELQRLVGTAPQVVAAGAQRRRVSLCCDELDTKVSNQCCAVVAPCGLRRGPQSARGGFEPFYSNMEIGSSLEEWVPKRI